MGGYRNTSEAAAERVATETESRSSMVGWSRVLGGERFSNLGIGKI